MLTCKFQIPALLVAVRDAEGIPQAPASENWVEVTIRATTTEEAREELGKRLSKVLGERVETVLAPEGFNGRVAAEQREYDRFIADSHAKRAAYLQQEQTLLRYPAVDGGLLKRHDVEMSGATNAAEEVAGQIADSMRARGALVTDETVDKGGVGLRNDRDYEDASTGVGGATLADLDDAKPVEAAAAGNMPASRVDGIW